MRLLRQALTVAAKDLRSEIRTKEAVNASLAFALVILLLFSFAFDPTSDQTREMSVGLLWLVWAWLHFQNEEYVITSRRIIHAEGVINKKASDSSLEKINDAILTESLFGRMFGFGDLEVLTASESGIENLHMLRNAKDFKKAMLDAKHELEIDLVRPTMPPLRQDAPAQAPAAPAYAPAPPPVAPQPEHMSSGDVSESIARLAELRDKGLITPAEYEAKKQEMLGRL